MRNFYHSRVYVKVYEKLMAEASAKRNWTTISSESPAFIISGFGRRNSAISWLAGTKPAHTSQEGTVMIGSPGATSYMLTDGA